MRRKNAANEAASRSNGNANFISVHSASLSNTLFFIIRGKLSFPFLPLPVSLATRTKTGNCEERECDSGDETVARNDGENEEETDRRGWRLKMVQLDGLCLLRFSLCARALTPPFELFVNAILSPHEVMRFLGARTQPLRNKNCSSKCRTIKGLAPLTGRAGEPASKENASLRILQKETK